MCRRRRVAVAAVGLVVALAAPPSVEARQVRVPLPSTPATENPEPYVPAGSEEELVQRLETLRPRMQEAARAYGELVERRRREAARRERPPLDTLEVGPFRIVTRPDQSDLAREIFGEVWEEEFGELPESAGPEGLYFAFQWRIRLERIRVLPPWEGGGPVTRIELDRLYYPLRADVRRRVHGAISDALVTELSPETPLRRWLAVGTDLDWQRAYRDMSLGASVSGVHRACVTGDASACWAALGLGYDGSMETLERWYTPPERMEVVRTRAPSSPYYEELPFPEEGTIEWDCVEQELQQACDAFLQAKLGWPWLDLRTGSAAPRWTLFWHAVGEGGPGAWGRLLERADAHPGEVLTHVSGLSPEELARSWFETVSARRPRLSADLAAERWVALFWVLVFTGLALRSTRWRSA